VPTPEIVIRTERCASSVNSSGGTTPAPVSSTAPFGQLVAQGKTLEEVSTRRQRESERSDHPNDMTHRA
jgi:hypothetical protein